MCLIALALKAHPHYPLVVIANRDEYRARPTRPAFIWDDMSTIGGQDLTAGGSWMAYNGRGRFAAVTNYRDGRDKAPTVPRSRGLLVTDFLSSDLSPQKFCEQILGRGDQYQGFNLLVAQDLEVWWVSNKVAQAIMLEPGVHAVSNHLLNTPWPKLTAIHQGLAQVLDNSELDPRLFLPLLLSTQQAPEDLLPNTGMGRSIERQLSPAFIDMPGYGTRSSSVLLRDVYGGTRFWELSWSDQGTVASMRVFERAG